MAQNSSEASEFRIKHKVLLRQLNRAKLVDGAQPQTQEQWEAFLRLVERAYAEHDQQDYLVTRAEQLAVDELKIANELLQRERELLTEKVRQRSKELENARRLAGIGTFRYDSASGCFELSSEMLSCLGRPISQDVISSSDFLNLVDDADHMTLHNAIKDALSQTNSPQDFELRLRAVDGTNRFFLCRLSTSIDTQNHNQIVVYGTAVDLTQRKKTDKTIHELATYDQLTGLQNRQAFKGNASNYFTNPFALLFIDLDGFKEINDSLGHAAGDLLLQEIARRLRSIQHDQFSLARFGGDEFIVLISFQDPNFDISRVTQKLLAEIEKPFTIWEEEVIVSGSIGISHYPKDADSIEQLLQYADAAMYAAKAAGRNQYCFYEQHMSAAITSRLDLVSRLRAAIRARALHVFFQPIVDGLNERIIGFEALARWTDPDLGSISPATFIPLAEQCGLIEELTEFVMEKSFTCIKQVNNLIDRPIYVSINISPIQFRNPNFVSSLLNQITAANVTPSCIQIELTEGAVVSDPEHAAKILKQLRREQIRIALDDFGTGYSSLAYLQNFSIDTLKIDKSFINDIRSADTDVPLVKAIIAIAKSLKMGIVAEGVETQAQRSGLLHLGCENMQGYLFHRPMSQQALTTVFTETVRQQRQRILNLVR